MGCVYLATNSVNGKQYVGWTIDFVNRKRMHKVLAERGDNPVFCRAIRKYGWGAFKWRILEWSEDEVALKESEVRLIRELNTRIPYGYNMTSGGEGFRGTHTEETRVRMSIAAMNRSLEVRQRTRLACANNRPSSLALSRSAEVRRGVPLTESHRAKLRIALQGDNNPAKSQAARGKISQALRGRPKSEAHREKLRISQLGRKNGPPSEKTRKKIAASVAKSWLKRRNIDRS